MIWVSEITADDDCSHEIKKCLLLGRKATTNLDSILKSRDITLPTKIHLVKAMVFPVVMCRCESWRRLKLKKDHEEGWGPKDWCFWTVVLKKTFQNPLDCKEIKSVNPKGNQSSIFIKRTNAEAIPHSVHWELGIPATGPPGKSLPQCSFWGNQSPIHGQEGCF